MFKIKTYFQVKLTWCIFIAKLSPVINTAWYYCARLSIVDSATTSYCIWVSTKLHCGNHHHVCTRSFQETVRMTLLLKNLCRIALTQTSRSVTTLTGQQNKWIDLCLGKYCTRKRSRIVVVNASYGFPWWPNISLKVRLLCEGANRRESGLLQKVDAL